MKTKLLVLLVAAACAGGIVRSAGQDDEVAGPLPEHPLEEVRARVDFRQPRRRALGAGVERGHALEVFDQIGAERREHVHARRDAGVHLLLNERRVKVPRVQGHETHVIHGPTLLPDAMDNAAGGSRGHD